MDGYEGKPSQKCEPTVGGVVRVFADVVLACELLGLFGGGWCADGGPVVA
jgi:hypothetical protein